MATAAEMVVPLIWLLVPVKQPLFAFQCPDFGRILAHLDGAFVASLFVAQREITDMDKTSFHLYPEIA